MFLDRNPESMFIEIQEEFPNEVYILTRDLIVSGNLDYVPETLEVNVIDLKSDTESIYKIFIKNYIDKNQYNALKKLIKKNKG